MISLAGNQLVDLFAILTSSSMTELTEDTYSKIYGMAPAETDFYFLTSNSIYSSSIITTELNFINEEEALTVLFGFSNYEFKSNI